LWIDEGKKARQSGLFPNSHGYASSANLSLAESRLKVFPNTATAREEFLFPQDLKLVIVIPVYNDWEAASLLLKQIDLVCAKNQLSPSVLLVNDGSTIPVPDDLIAWRPVALLRVEVLDVSKNLGHQRAICVAMVHLSQNSSEAALLVMDADGQDPPEQIPSLVRTYVERGQRTAVFAARRRRVEGIIFKVFYQLYRLSHLLLVGSDIRIGNFSIVPPNIVARLVRSSDLWNHYAASVIKSKLPMTTIPIDRAERLKGRSKMNFVGLLMHGLTAMSVYSDIVGVRILMSSCVLFVFGFIILISVVIIRLFTTWVVPGWATTVAGLTLVLMFQIVIVCLLFAFGILASRGGPGFIPIRDCPHFVLDVRRLEFRHV
jgi:polyisoprenyl-phosphate glycosyltransferase